MKMIEIVIELDWNGAIVYLSKALLGWNWRAFFAKVMNNDLHVFRSPSDRPLTDNFRWQMVAISQHPPPSTFSFQIEK